jgi:hypothetical protein
MAGMKTAGKGKTEGFQTSNPHAPVSKAGFATSGLREPAPTPKATYGGECVRGKGMPGAKTKT